MNLPTTTAPSLTATSTSTNSTTTPVRSRARRRIECVVLLFTAIVFGYLAVTKHTLQYNGYDTATDTNGNIMLDDAYTKHDYEPATKELKGNVNASITVGNTNLELSKVVGQGAVSIGFTARFKHTNFTTNNSNTYNFTTTNDDKQYIAKVNYRKKHLHFTDTEVQMFTILNEAPTIPNIPILEVVLDRIKNPFRHLNPDTLKRTFQIKDTRSAKKLSNAKKISIIVMELLSGNTQPSNLQELRIFLQSLLETLNFAHSRNVMMCDLHRHNYYFDPSTGIVKIFDWNAGAIFVPHQTKIHSKYEPVHLLPPEAWNNTTKNAVHVTVSGFDIWTVGLLIDKIMKKDFVENDMAILEKNDPILYPLVIELRDLMLTKDPYRRPNGTELLQHNFFQ